MMIRTITIETFLTECGGIALADVRTPAEFAQGHVPGAYNLPLFTNEERVLVGTTYKQIGREQAILLGFDLTGPKWSDYIRQALAFAPEKRIALHCWRGGMRSAAMAWALDLYGFEVLLIEGGYKRYRQWARQQFDRPYRLRVLGGMTGSGKTTLLRELKEMGEQVIDLEDLAQHQGSSYGSLNRLVQPTQEQFENNLARQLGDLDPDRPVWVEDESMSIGKNLIPRPFWTRMKSGKLIFLQVPPQERVEALVRTYGKLDKDFLVTCTERIRKRLGPLQTKLAVAAIREDRMDDFVRQVLVYYDKTYRTDLVQRPPAQIVELALAAIPEKERAKYLRDFADPI